jgi:hypothetical protein
VKHIIPALGALISLMAIDASRIAKEYHPSPPARKAREVAAVHVEENMSMLAVQVKTYLRTEWDALPAPNRESLGVA